MNVDPFSKCIWFLGVVEDVNDPLKVNRVRVRCIGHHTDDRGALPTSSLPWASFMHSSMQMSAPMCLPGTWVMGFFLDSEYKQQPIILGMIDGIPTQKDPNSGFSDPSNVYPKVLNKPTNSPLARGDLSADNPITYSKGTVTSGVQAGTGSWSEPATPYAATYPNNHVIETDAGNIIEMDDTPGAERVNIFHKSGSFTEFHTDGSVVHRALNGRYSIIMDGENVAVTGDCNFTCTGDMNFLASGDVTIGGKSITLSASEQVDIGGQNGVNLTSDSGNIQGRAMTTSFKSSVLFAADAASIALSSGASEAGVDVDAPVTPTIAKVPLFGNK